MFTATSNPSRQIVVDATRRRVSIDELVRALCQQGDSQSTLFTKACALPASTSNSPRNGPVWIGLDICKAEHFTQPAPGQPSDLSAARVAPIWI